MPPAPKNQWGLFLFLCAFGFIVAALAALRSFAPAGHPWLYETILPLIGVGLSVAVLVIGHFSYPRIHDLKVYAGGFLYGIIGISFFGSQLLHTAGFVGKIPAPFVDTTYVLLFINGAILPFLPSSATYRATKQITYPLLALEATALFIAGAVPQAMAWICVIEYEGPLAVTYWTPFIWAGVVAWLTSRFAANEFHLGGVISGVIVIVACTWLGVQILEDGDAFELLLLCCAQFYLAAGLSIHWFMRIEHRIVYDPLLQIYNRDYCMQILSERSKINCTPPFAIAMVDIDHFKNVNDTHGHQAGDVVLHEVAQTVKSAVLPDGVLCRYGGEELAVFFPQKSAVDVRPIMEETRKALEETKIKTGKKTISVTISVGIAHRNSMSTPLSEVMAAADKALYKAKEGGRNQVKVGKTTEKKTK